MPREPKRLCFGISIYDKAVQHKNIQHTGMQQLLSFNS